MIQELFTGAFSFMAKLTAAGRSRIPSSKFAGPGRSFPIHDRSHARFAIAAASRSQHAGNISASTAAHIKARARAKLASGKFAQGGGMAGMSMLRNMAGKAKAFGGRVKAFGSRVGARYDKQMSSALKGAAQHPRKYGAGITATNVGIGAGAYAYGKHRGKKEGQQQYAQGGPVRAGAQHEYHAMYGSRAPGASVHVPTQVTLQGPSQSMHATAFTAGGRRTGNTADVGKFAQGGYAAGRAGPGAEPGGARFLPYRERTYQFRHGGKPAGHAGYDQHEAGEDEHPHPAAHERMEHHAEGGQIGDAPPHPEHMEGGRSPTGHASADVGRRGGIRVKNWHGNVGYKEGGSPGEVDIHIDQVKGTHNVDEDDGDDKYAHGGRVEEHFGAHGSRAGNAATHKRVMHAADHPDTGGHIDKTGARASQMTPGGRQTYKGQGPQYKHGGKVKKRRYADGGMTGGRRHAMQESKLRDYV